MAITEIDPILFWICIDDLDCGISSDVSKFVDNMKIGGLIRSDSHVIALPVDLDRMNE